MVEARQNQYQRMFADTSGGVHTSSEEQQSMQQRQEIKPRLKYKRILFRLGLAEVLLGGISGVLASATLIIASEYEKYSTYYGQDFANYGQGIWAGAFLIATGILGIRTKGNPSRCLYNSNLAMSLITANMMVPLMTLSALAASSHVELYSPAYRLYGLVTLHSILAVLGFSAAIVCIVHSAYCCAGICCRATSYHGPVVYVADPYVCQQPQQLVQLANGQYMLVPICQPMDQRVMMFQHQLVGVVAPRVILPQQASAVHPAMEHPFLSTQQPPDVGTSPGSTDPIPPPPYSHAPATQGQPSISSGVVINSDECGGLVTEGDFGSEGPA